MDVQPMKIEPSPQLAYLLGSYILHYESDIKKNSRVLVKFATSDEAVQKKIQDCVAIVFNKKINYKGNYVTNYMEKIGVTLRHIIENELFAYVYEPTEVKEFLTGLFEFSGNYGIKKNTRGARIRFSGTKNQDRLEDICIILTKFGIIPYFNFQNTRKWIDICYYEQLKKIKEEIKFVSEEKKKKLELIIENSYKKPIISTYNELKKIRCYNKKEFLNEVKKIADKTGICYETLMRWCKNKRIPRFVVNQEKIKDLEKKKYGDTLNLGYLVRKIGIPYKLAKVYIKNGIRISEFKKRPIEEINIIARKILKWQIELSQTAKLFAMPLSKVDEAIAEMRENEMIVLIQNYRAAAKKNPEKNAELYTQTCEEIEKKLGIDRKRIESWLK